MSLQDGGTYRKPADIERRSFQIIGEELGETGLDYAREQVVKRVIHTTADFDYAKTLSFSDHAIERGIAAFQVADGIVQVVDTVLQQSIAALRTVGALTP